jgi:hypothetical protein
MSLQYGSFNTTSAITVPYPVVNYICEPTCNENSKFNIHAYLCCNSSASVLMELMFNDGTIIGSYYMNYTSPIYITATSPSKQGWYTVIGSIIG